MLSVVKDINTPRLPSLKGKMRAKSFKATTWNAAALGAEEARLGFAGSPTKVVKIFPPAPRGQREMLSGTIEDQIGYVGKKLKEQALI